MKTIVAKLKTIIGAKNIYFTSIMNSEAAVL